jgi:hypothetical protein
MRAADPIEIIAAAEHARFRWDRLVATRTQAQPPRPFWRG